MKRYLFAVLILLLVAGAASAADPAGQSMTVSRYTELLVPLLGFEGSLPAGYEKLTPDEACRARKGVLIAQGLSSFADADCPQCLTRCLLADVTFELVRRQYNMTAVTCAEKIRLLAEAGFLAAGEPTECVPANEVLRLLQLPFFTSAVAAYFGIRPPLGTQPTDIVSDPFFYYRIKNVTEETASPILPSRKK